MFRAELPGLHPGEEVVIFRRRHWFILLQRLIAPTFLLTALSALAWGLDRLAELELAQHFLLWLLVASPALAWGIWRFLDWENDHYFVTTERVVHIERIYFLFESRREASLDKIQDVTVELPNPIANLLYFGNVVIETAGETGRIVFEMVPKPRKVQSTIFRLVPGMRDRVPPPPPPQQPFFSHFAAVFYHLLWAQYPKDKAIAVWRKHWWVLFTSLIVPIISLVGWVLAWLVVSSIWGSARWLDALFGIGLAALLLWIAIVLVDWRNDLYVLTEDHVIDIEKRPFIFEHRREANLGMVQDVSYSQPTFLHKLLNFGNLRLETAGTMGELTFDNVPHPREVQRTIFERLSIFKRQAEEEAARRRREEIFSLMDEYFARRWTQGSEP